MKKVYWPNWKPGFEKQDEKGWYKVVEDDEAEELLRSGAVMRKDGEIWAANFTTAYAEETTDERAKDLLIFGILFFIAGIGLSIYGIILNNRYEYRLYTVFYQDAANPAMLWLSAGIAIGLIGFAMLLVGMIKKNR